MRKLAYLVGLVAASALVSSACVEKIDTDPPGGGSGGTAGSGGGTGGDTNTLTELYGSGSRLQAVYVDAGEGADRFLHFYDSDLDQTCAFAEVGDGAVRCAPTQLATVHYTDANCETPVVLQRACDAELPAHLSAFADDACQDANLRQLTTYTVGAAATPTTVYVNNGQGCVEDTTYDDANDLVYEIAAADETIFAEATLEDHEADGGLGQRVATTEDGAFQVLGAYNVAREESCSATPVGDETLCLGANLAFGVDLHSSASCDSADVAYSLNANECGDPQAVVKYTPAQDQCEPATTTLHAVGDEVDAASVYTDAYGSCELTPDAERRYFEIGGEAMEGVVPSLVAETVGTGRLTLQRMTTADAVPIGYADFAYLDTDRDESCSLRGTTAGDKCLPEMLQFPNAGTGYFADDQCTVQLVNVAAAVCATEPPTYASFWAEDTGTCATYAVETVHAVGAEHTGPVYQDVAGTCTEGTFEGIDFYELGSEVALSDFADLQQVTQTAE